MNVFRVVISRPPTFPVGFRSLFLQMSSAILIDFSFESFCLFPLSQHFFGLIISTDPQPLLFLGSPSTFPCTIFALWFLRVNGCNRAQCVVSSLMAPLGVPLFFSLFSFFFGLAHVRYSFFPFLFGSSCLLLSVPNRLSFLFVDLHFFPPRFSYYPSLPLTPPFFFMPHPLYDICPTVFALHYPCLHSLLS